MVEIIGWIGAICFGISAIPQAYFTWKTKDASGLSWSFLLLWIIGVLCTWIYIGYGDYVGNEIHWPLHINYLISGSSCMYLLYVKMKYSNKN